MMKGSPELELTQPLHIGLCGAGIVGLAAAIALYLAGVQVTVLEAASSFEEIGVGIQLTLGASKLLIKRELAGFIGEFLVEVEELTLRERDGTKAGVGHTNQAEFSKKSGVTVSYLNLDFSHHVNHVVKRVEEINIKELRRQQFAEYDPRNHTIRIVGMTDSWRPAIAIAILVVLEEKLVLMGDGQVKEDPFDSCLSNTKERT